MTLRVNGELRQESHSGNMSVTIPEIIAHYSALGYSAGDIISTGTVSGVAGFSENAAELYLRPGDVVECEIERIGKLANPVISWEAGLRRPGARRCSAGDRVGWAIDTVKLERVRTLMAAEGLDTLVVRAPDNVSYLTNYWPMKGYDVAILPLEGEPTLLVMEPQFEEAQRTAWTADVRPFPFYDPGDPRPPAVRAQARCVELLGERGAGRVGLEQLAGHAGR